MAATLTDLTERMDLDEITRQAKQIKTSTAILTVIAAVLFGVFWAAAKIFTVVIFAFKWCFVAGRRGWRAGLGHADPVPTVEELLRALDIANKQIARYESGQVGFAPVAPHG